MKTRRKESGGALGTVVGLVLVLGLVGAGVWAARSYMTGKEEKKIQDKYFEAKKSDFIVTVKLAGNLASTDVEVLKCELEGSTTIQSIVEEGTKVEGPTQYILKEGDALAGIAKAHDRHELSIRQLNDKSDLDWDNLSAGQTIQIPGDLLVELDPINLKERINSQEIGVEKARNALVRAQGGLETMKLSTALELKRAENSHQNAVLDLKKVENSTIQTHIQDEEGKIENLRKRVSLSELNVKAYSELRKLGFVSDVEVKKQEADAADTQHKIKITLAELEAYKKYDQVKSLSEAQLKVDEALVTIQKTKVENSGDLNDANSTVSTAQKTLELEIEKLKDLQEQMANTRIYAPDKGTVVYWSESSRYGRSSSEPITDGASVRRGQNLIKLPKTDSLKVELSIPQSSRGNIRRGMKAWIQVEEVILRGTVTKLASTVDTNQRSFSNRTGFKAAVSVDADQEMPDSVSEGMAAKVEILVKELTGKNQLIKVPNQCITSRTLGEDKSETGCWVLNGETGKHDWRPVGIEYHDEDFIAISEEEPGTGRGLVEGERVFLSPLSEADRLNLEESIQNKGAVKGVKQDKDSEKAVGPVAAKSSTSKTRPEGPASSGGGKGDASNKAGSGSSTGTKTAGRPQGSGDRPSGGGRSSGSSFEPLEELKLTAEQKQKWEDAAEFSKAAFEDARDRQASTEFGKIREEFGAEIKKFLTPEQVATYEKLRAQQSQGRSGPGGRGGGSMLSRLDKDGDGKISESEYSELSERARQFMGDFSAMDTNGDGHIDSAEQEEAGRRMREQSQNRGGAGGGRGGN